MKFKLLLTIAILASILLTYTSCGNKSEQGQSNKADKAESSKVIDNKDEITFICSLLYGRDHNKAAADSGKMISILADSINEKLFEEFGDTVIEFSEDETGFELLEKVGRKRGMIISGGEIKHE